MSTMTNDAFTLIWLVGGAMLVTALFTLLGRRPGQRRRRQPQADEAPPAGK